VSPDSADPLHPLRLDPARAIVLTDFDGTLSALVDDPAAAAAAAGAVEALERLAARYALVGVVSGRPVAFLRRQLGDRLWLSGLYGLETFAGGRTRELEAASSWRPVVAGATRRAEARFGPAVEGKGLSLTLHFRSRPELEPTLRAWAASESRSTGLLLRPAKASIELHPPLAPDKGWVVEAAVAERGPGSVDAVCFMGDDLGDVPAFDALDRLAARGIATVRVAAATADTPDELLARADLVVDGPDGAVALLRSL
jgi:trehalose 6-phosphate phosphatase